MSKHRRRQVIPALAGPARLIASPGLHRTDSAPTPETESPDPVAVDRLDALRSAGIASTPAVFVGQVPIGESIIDDTRPAEPGELTAAGDYAIGLGVDLVEVSFFGLGRPRGRAWLAVAVAEVLAARLVKAAAEVRGRESAATAGEV